MPKNKTDNRTVEIKKDDQLDIQADIIIFGMKSKFAPTKRNEYGTNQLFQVLDETQLGYTFAKISRRKY